MTPKKRPLRDHERTERQREVKLTGEEPTDPIDLTPEARLTFWGMYYHRKWIDEDGVNPSEMAQVTQLTEEASEAAVQELIEKGLATR